MKDNNQTMKKAAILAAALLAVSCGTAPVAQKTTTSTNKTAKAAKTEMVGGYTTPRELTEAEAAMFRKVTGTSDMVLTPSAVSTQVVAGTNYLFFCTYTDRTTGATGRCKVVIYKDLQGGTKLSRIEKQ